MKLVLQNEIRIVQAALIGSILSNMLLVMGTSFLLGGLNYREQVAIFFLFELIFWLCADCNQVYNSTATQISAYLLSLSVMSLLLPVRNVLSLIFLAFFFIDSYAI